VDVDVIGDPQEDAAMRTEALEDRVIRSEGCHLPDEDRRHRGEDCHLLEQEDRIPLIEDVIV